MLGGGGDDEIQVRPEPESLPLSSGCQTNGIFLVYNDDASITLIIWGKSKRAREVCDGATAELSNDATVRKDPGGADFTHTQAIHLPRHSLSRREQVLVEGGGGAALLARLGEATCEQDIMITCDRGRGQKGI